MKSRVYLSKNASSRGITLIALVITIIVLLILAGVSIAMISGNDGIASRATGAKEKTRAADMQEQINLAVSDNKMTEYADGTIKTKEDLVEKFVSEGKLTEEEASILDTQDTIEIGGTTVDFTALKKVTRVVGDGNYETLSECIEEANEGDKILISKVISDETVVINKSVKITSSESIILNNVTITVASEDVELTVSNLNFTGKSYINANNAQSLIVENVNAEVTLDSSDAVTNSRAAFISLGASEMNDKPLYLKIMNNNIVVTGNNYPDPILGWRYIADGSIISNNTFGAEGKENWEAVRLMNFMDNATITMKNNVAYVSGNGFALCQNNSRENSYTAIIEKNTFLGSADYIWLEMTGTGNILASIVANDNIANGSALDVSMIKSNGKNINYAVVDLKTDGEGKFVGGTYSSLTSDDYIEYVNSNLASGYSLESNSDGSFSIVSSS